MEESSFAILFPRYREKYLREMWTLVQRAVGEHGIDAELDAVEGRITVKTTRATRDPYIIIKARDMMKLLARGVAMANARRVLEPEMFAEIVQIGGYVANRCVEQHCGLSTGEEGR